MKSRTCLLARFCYKYPYITMKQLPEVDPDIIVWGDAPEPTVNGKDILSAVTPAVLNSTPRAKDVLERLSLKELELLSAQLCILLQLLNCLQLTNPDEVEISDNAPAASLPRHNVQRAVTFITMEVPESESNPWAAMYEQAETLQRRVWGRIRILKRTQAQSLRS